MILRSWKKSLMYFSFYRKPFFPLQAFKYFGARFGFFMRHFIWLFALDIFLFFFFLDVMRVIYRASINLQSSSHIQQFFVTPGASFVMLIWSVVWLLANLLLFLSIRKKAKTFDARYFEFGVLGYIQLSLIFAVFFLGIAFLLNQFGIVNFIDLPWPISFLLRMTGVTITLYWLDGSFSFVGLLKSIECGINLVFYNAPFYLILLVFLFFFDLFVDSMLVYIAGLFDIGWGELLQRKIFLYFVTEQASSSFFFSGIMTLRYAQYFIEYYLITCIYLLYRDKKQVIYTQHYL